jgi:hypothetical protein
MHTRKPYDDVAWVLSTQIWEDWPELLRTDSDIYLLQDDVRQRHRRCHVPWRENSQ